MRILKIEIDGFKSYGQYQALERLDAQFNAITGLNGSGKSNILDSICFLLGISHLQYIRAENNEELVFKKGQGGITKATVTITFDNSDPKHRPIGYETDKTIVVRRQIVLNGKQSYHINNMPAGPAKVADLFNSCSMNVNNPHFLIMQGRVTKVLNMKPREILLMIEEAAGVRVYENKRRTALNTMDKKGVKIDQMNKMMDEEILPRLNKLRGERDLYNEYLKLGRDIENNERLHHCLDFWSADSTAKRVRESIEQLVQDNEASTVRMRQIEDIISDETTNLREMEDRLNGDLTAERNEKQSNVTRMENELANKEAQLNKKKDDIKDLDGKISQLKKNIAEDEDRLHNRKSSFENMNNEHGNEAVQFAKAQQQKEQCEKVLNALDRGLVTDEDGRELSLQQQIQELQSKLNTKEAEARIFKERLDAFEPELREKEQKYASSTRRSSNNLELMLKTNEDEIAKLQERLGELNVNDKLREEIAAQRNHLATEKTQLNDKVQDIRNRYTFLNFTYRTPPNFNDDDVIGPFAKLIRPKQPDYMVALEIALGGIITNVVVRTRETAKRLLAQGQLERRITFIPLDNLSFRPLRPQQWERAVDLVGEENVFRAIDLVEFDEQNRRAVEYALGSILVCRTPDDAKKVCFDREIRARVVTLDGDDYRPDGFLTGGSRQNRASVLGDLDFIRNVSDKTADLDARIKQLDEKARIITLTRSERDSVSERIDNLRLEIRNLKQQMQNDESSVLRERIAKLKSEITKSKKGLNELQPFIDHMKASLRDLEDKQRNEAAYRDSERRRAEQGLREAEQTLNNLKGASEKARQQLDLLKMDVEALTASIDEDKRNLAEEEERRVLLDQERNEFLQGIEQSKVRLAHAKQEFNQFMIKFREHANDIKQKTEYIETLKKQVREINQSKQNFQRDHEDLSRRATECEKRALIIERQHSWITEEKADFNRPGTQYDFRNLTVRELQQQIREMKDRREELDKRVNINAMKSLAEEEERAQDLDNKRKALEQDRELLHRTIFEIDAEKKRELENAYKKISRDFGNIFSTILPGATSKLQTVDANELTNGLQIRVAFNNQWKESLDELSGGQRSLVALSLILAMLKCNPAPIYILDEVDAALDVSHTANIGTMIRQHFKESQFIIVSLKEGMFNNANVIYRTQFVNGTSMVRRTENAITRK